jgi:hypothetical protein
MGRALRGGEMIDGDGHRHGGRDPIDLALPFAHVPDGDRRGPKATAKHDKRKNGTKCADSGSERKQSCTRRQVERARCRPVSLHVTTPWSLRTRPRCGDGFR